MPDEGRPAVRRAHQRFFAPDPRSVDRFGLLLVITVLAVIVLSVVDLRNDLSDVQGRIGIVLYAAFVGSTLLVAMRSAGVAPRYRRIAEVIIGLGVIGTLVVVVASTFSPAVADGRTFAGPSGLWTVLALLAPPMVVARLLQHRRISLQTLAGAVSAYLLIALAFDLVYLTWSGATARPFFAAAEPTTSFMYYSLATITTVGYGDLVTADTVGRLLSMAEAVIGQVYLVTFVGFMVGVLVSQRTTRDDARDAGGDAP